MKSIKLILFISSVLITNQLSAADKGFESNAAHTGKHTSNSKSASTGKPAPRSELSSPTPSLSATAKPFETTAATIPTASTASSAWSSKSVKAKLAGTTNETMPLLPISPEVKCDNGSSKLDSAYFSDVIVLAEPVTTLSSVATLAISAPSVSAYAGAGSSASSLSPEEDYTKAMDHKGALPHISQPRSTYSHGLTTRISFDKVMSDLENGRIVDPRELEKAAVDARTYPESYTPLRVANLLQKLKNHRIIQPDLILTPATLGEFYDICDKAKMSKAAELLDATEKLVTQMQELKSAQDYTTRLYATMNGTCSGSPRAEYGMGHSFSENPVKAYQQAIAKAAALVNKTKEDLK